jgi:hypothetical protein
MQYDAGVGLGLSPSPWIHWRPYDHMFYYSTGVFFTLKLPMVKRLYIAHAGTTTHDHGLIYGAGVIVSTLCAGYCICPRFIYIARLNFAPSYYITHMHLRGLNIGCNPRFRATPFDHTRLCNGTGAFLERESAIFGLLLFLAKLTPAMPNLVEFC